jgi:hypothetical protein
MALLRPDPTFYPSPRLAMQAPPEKLARSDRQLAKQPQRDVSAENSRMILCSSCVPRSICSSEVVVDKLIPQNPISPALCNGARGLVLQY